MNGEKLYKIGAYNNPRRHGIRAKLLRDWVPRNLDAGVDVTVVEHAFGDRPYEFSQDEPNFKHVRLVQLRGGPEHELWLSYALINVGFSRLPENANYISWEDTDVEHHKKDHASETIHMLQHHVVGQTWSTSIDLGPTGSIIANEWGHESDRSFSAAWVAGDIGLVTGEPYGDPLSTALLDPARKRDARRHPGYSWAIRRSALKGIGKLIDWMVVGSEDWYMANGFAGLIPVIIKNKSKDDPWVSDSWFRRLGEFGKLCDAYIKQDIGVVPGTIAHHWHGSKKTRHYINRNDIVKESKFDPDKDIVINFQGLPTLCTDNRILRDGLRRYNMLREQDA